MYTFSSKAKTVTYILMAIGLISLIAGYISYDESHHQRWWANLLVNGFFFFGISLGALFFYALQYATETAWSMMVRRIFESIFSYLPIGAIVIVIVLLASSLHINHLYHWMDNSVLHEFRIPDGDVTASAEEVGHAHEVAYSYVDAMEEGAESNPNYDSIIANKTAFLNLPFFWVRSLIYIGVFLFFANWFRKKSLLEDTLAGGDTHMKMYKRSAIFLVVFAVFSSTMSWDWLMSIDTHWFSTMYGWYVFSGMWVGAMTAGVLLVMYMKKKGLMPNLNESHIHDMGKWMFAISFLWTYLWFSQFMLIWYSDIPEETTYFIMRIQEYKLPFFLMVGVNFVFPMLVLMARDAKRNFTFLFIVCMIILVGHFVDTYLLVIPGTLFDHHHPGLFEVGLFLGFLGLFAYKVLSTLSKAPLEPKNSPYMDESIHHHI